MPETAKVYVRPFDETQEPHVIEVGAGTLGTSNYERFLSGLTRKVDPERYWVDSEEADAADERARA